MPRGASLPSFLKLRPRWEDLAEQKRWVRRMLVLGSTHHCTLLSIGHSVRDPRSIIPQITVRWVEGGEEVLVEALSLNAFDATDTPSRTPESD